MFLNHLLVFLDHFLQCLGVESSVELGFLVLLLGVEYFVECRLRNFQDHVAKHLDQAAVRVVGKTRILAATGQRFDALIVEPEVQNCVHHSWHGELRARADAYQQRVLALAQFLPLKFFQPLQRFFHLLIHLLGYFLTTHIFAASLSLDGESRRHGKAGIGHFRQTRTFAAQFILHLAVAVSFAPTKKVDVLRSWLLIGGCELGFWESLRRH